MAFSRLLHMAFLLLMIGTTQAQPYSDMILGVPNFKPYTYLENGEIKGSGVIQVKKILKNIAVKYRIEHFNNYSMLLKALKHQKIHGFFLATQNAERDKYAVLAQPIDINNWIWFTLKSSSTDTNQTSFKRQSKIATIGKTNTYRWLIRNGYHVISSERTKLPYLLMNQQVDAVFLAEKVFEQACEELNIEMSQFHKTIEMKRPFSIYISKRYLAKNKAFLDELNSHIASPK